ncbi:hypothetical protein [Candidatus Soleaferrea massiliensis]|uniref:hypothetical protein n=1 Tax=Candidatus Soleaferrea massiliensis TaxID=1470354 RepID=UPI00058B3CF5|nr:hypothetical protein [Candidatus Soleaferrea massiliensis]
MQYSFSSKEGNIRISYKEYMKQADRYHDRIMAVIDDSSLTMEECTQRVRQLHNEWETWKGSHIIEEFLHSE